MKSNDSCAENQMPSTLWGGGGVANIDSASLLPNFTKSVSARETTDSRLFKPPHAHTALLFSLWWSTCKSLNARVGRRASESSFQGNRVHQKVGIRLRL